MVCVYTIVASVHADVGHFTHSVFSVTHLFTHHSFITHRLRGLITHISIHLLTHPPTLFPIMLYSVHDLTELRRAALRGLARTHGDDVEAVAPLIESFVAMRSSGEDTDRDEDRDRDTCVCHHTCTVHTIDLVYSSIG